MRTDRIERTKQFLHEQLQTDIEGQQEQGGWGPQYRYEHSLRVAAVGKKIAEAEGFDAEHMVIGCLLHDVGYGICRTVEDHRNHGELSARVARPFLVELGLDTDVVEAICYGILTHVLGDEKYGRPCTAFEATISDADNIDRFGALRMAQSIGQKEFMQKRPDETVSICQKIIDAYTGYKEMPCGTKTAQAMWCEVLDEQIRFFSRLKAQMQSAV